MDTRAEALLAGAVDGFRRGCVGDALLWSECASRLVPESGLPSLLSAQLLQDVRPDLALKIGFRAWKRDPEHQQVQDQLLQAWQQAGAASAVRALGAVILPQRVRDGSHEPVLGYLARAGLERIGVCWLTGEDVHVALCSLVKSGANRACLELYPGDAPMNAAPVQRFEVPVNRVVRLLLPECSTGVWSLVWNNGGAPLILQGCPLVGTEAFSPLPKTERRGKTVAETIVDVVVPVYGDAEGVRACLDSVLESQRQNETSTEIVVINDASPDQSLVSWLESLADAGKITLLQNRCNLGFVETTNRGLRLHPGRDVIMLNSDTQVHGDWVDRLRQALYCESDIASASPWSNNGEISSFPNLHRPSSAPSDSDLAMIDTLARQLHEGGQLRDHGVPSNCGFAMMMRRQVIEQIGVLDGAGLSRGYGEEVDWCQRARAAGFRHVIATGVFVAHGGSTSFGYEKTLRVRQNNRVLQSRYPRFRPEYHRFLRDDPLKNQRQVFWEAVQGGAPAWANVAVPPRLPPAGLPKELPPELPGCALRIAVWNYSPTYSGAERVLELARAIARRQCELRLLVFGHAEDALWRTGVVDCLVPGSSEDERTLSDAMLVGFSGCLALLAQDPLPPRRAMECITIDQQFQPEVWLEDFLSRYGISSTHSN